MVLDISMVNPYIRVAINSVLPAKSQIIPRIIFDYELIYIEEGEFTLTYDGKEYKCEKGQFILLRPGVSHKFSGIEKDLVQPHIHFDITHTDNSSQVPVSFKDIDAMTVEEKNQIREDIFYGYEQLPLVYFSDKEKVLRLFYEVINLTEQSMLVRKARLIEIIEALINDNFPNVFEQKYKVYRIEKQIKDFIDAGQGMTANLEDIAKQFSYSKYYLDRRFKEKYSVGIMSYRNRKRMQTAKQMLKDNTVSAVSERLGFSSIYVFSRAFKNHFGVSPTDIKKTE